MFVDFEKALEMDKSQNIPKPLLEYYSKSLPDGLRYKEIEPGVAVIEGFKRIGGLVPELSEQDRMLLGPSPTPRDILYYAFNAQKEIKMVPVKAGYYLLDGKEVPVEKYVLFDNGLSIKNEAFHIQPQPFADPFQVDVEGNGCKITLIIQQQAYDSITESKFSSIGDTCFQLTYYINRDRAKPLRFNISYQLDLAKNVQEGVEALKLYNAFAVGEGAIGGTKLNQGKVSVQIPNRTIAFWERVADVERICSVSFALKTEDISFEEAMDIERLYQNLVLKRPIRDWHQIDSLNIPGAGNDIELIKKDSNLGHNAFQYVTTYVVNILGKELKLPSIACTYHLSYSVRKVTHKDEYKITFKKDDQRFTSSLSFVDQDTMDAFIAENPNFATVIQECVDVRQEMLLRDRVEQS